jgi:hypothetical protein
MSQSAKDLSEFLPTTTNTWQRAELRTCSSLKAVFDCAQMPMKFEIFWQKIQLDPKFVQFEQVACHAARLCPEFRVDASPRIGDMRDWRWDTDVRYGSFVC